MFMEELCSGIHVSSAINVIPVSEMRRESREEWRLTPFRRWTSRAYPSSLLAVARGVDAVTFLPLSLYDPPEGRMATAEVEVDVDVREAGGAFPLCVSEHGGRCARGGKEGRRRKGGGRWTSPFAARLMLQIEGSDVDVKVEAEVAEAKVYVQDRKRPRWQAIEGRGGGGPHAEGAWDMNLRFQGGGVREDAGRRTSPLAAGRIKVYLSSRAGWWCAKKEGGGGGVERERGGARAATSCRRLAERRPRGRRAGRSRSHMSTTKGDCAGASESAARGRRVVEGEDEDEIPTCCLLHQPATGIDFVGLCFAPARHRGRVWMYGDIQGGKRARRINGVPAYLELQGVASAKQH
ncbi:hypothetical protein B0H13DRAFT_1873570 [Mycena leptocephala]|nr:hypothetical protein B0H13DRAFT_1873570 [Mycena leptocephala]